MQGYPRARRVAPCVVFDLNTQVDYCAVAGAHPVQNAGELIPSLQRIMEWVRSTGTLMVSAVQSRRQWEVADNGQPSGCVDGTPGHRKLDFTKLPQRTVLTVDNTLTVPVDVVDRFQQVIFQQRSCDPLDNPKADSFVSEICVGEYAIFGNTVERSVRALALGLVARERRVTVIRDACGFWDRSAADLSFRLMAAERVRIMTVDEFISRGPDDFCIPTPINGNGRMAHPPTTDDEQAMQECGEEPMNGNGNCNGNGNGNGRHHSADNGGHLPDASGNGKTHH